MTLCLPAPSFETSQFSPKSSFGAPPCHSDHAGVWMRSTGSWSPSAAALQRHISDPTHVFLQWLERGAPDFVAGKRQLSSTSPFRHTTYLLRWFLCHWETALSILFGPHHYSLQAMMKTTPNGSAVHPSSGALTSGRTWPVAVYVVKRGFILFTSFCSAET